jgi:hypothetical protein
MLSLCEEKEMLKKRLRKTWTHELQASLKPFSIAGIKFEGIACPIIMLSNSNLPSEPDGRGSMYLHIVSCQFVMTLRKELNKTGICMPSERFSNTLTIPLIQNKINWEGNIQ